MSHRCILCDWSPNVPSISNPTAHAKTFVAGTDYCDTCYAIVLQQLAYWKVVDRGDDFNFMESPTLSLRKE